MAQLVECLSLDHRSGHDPRVMESSFLLDSTAECRACLIFFFSLCPSSSLVCSSFSLSLSRKKIAKYYRTETLRNFFKKNKNNENSNLLVWIRILSFFKNYTASVLVLIIYTRAHKIIKSFYIEWHTVANKFG